MDVASALETPRPKTRRAAPASSAILAALSVLGALPAQAAVDDYLGKPIASVRLLV